MTKRYFILLYNKIDMKMKIPSIPKKYNQVIMVLILLVVVIFITAMPWASNTFHEALEDMASQDTTTTPPTKEEVKANLSTKVEDKKASISSNVSSATGEATSTSTPTTQEGFVGDLLFKESPTTFPGAPLDTSSWNPSDNVTGSMAVPLDRNSLYMFNNAHYSPQCCAKGPGSGMSSSMGCVCLTNADAFYITEGRGGGNMNPTNII